MSYVNVSGKVEAEFDVDVECSECGGDLECVFNNGDLKVAPCPTCLEEARKAGYDDGYDSGCADGHSEGYEAGYGAGEEAERDRHEL